MAFEKLSIKQLPNIRDLGGFETTDGKRIVYGKLFRSGKLYKLKSDTKESLKRLNLNYVIDLRIETERQEKPDTILDGVTYLNYSLLCTATPAITADKSMRLLMKKESKRIKKEFGTADNYMVEMYKRILLNEDSKETLKKILSIIHDNEGVLWHCNGGKDRAGLVAMLIEGLLGIKEETIIEDYVISHKYQRKKLFWSNFGLSIAFLGTEFRKIILNMLSAKPIYITETLKFINETYGSIENYAKAELGIDDKFIEDLKNKYLE
ncbi:MAG: tyrosine-protein phosphatase [Clostridia bacterium]|nr:tyrosine-protein phosphatase [Clostridia bacterium]